MVCKVVFGGDENVIHVSLDVFPVPGFNWSKQFVHHSLESGRGVPQTKIHYHWFVLSQWCFERSFELVTFFYSDVMVPPSDVKLGEQGFSVELLDQWCDEW